ncbi:MAG TPA: hypothetical protein DCE41_03665 [Cytophagales bacterium]|nr:hypothetical protein [Cytophagales bacterium]HAA21633.1 hypothetical protein [Cytophagales bacterium]HAP60425.1 hypothetical protein [Cytophagales bacterium]
MKTAILIDDESDALLVAKELLDTYCPDIQVLGTAQNIADGIELIQEHAPDVVFLDISMPNGSGFDLLKQLPNRTFQVIFVTAYNQHAVQALRMSAVDYLLKPIDPDELMEAVKRLDQIFLSGQQELIMKQLQQNLEQPTARRLTLTTTEGVHFIELEDLIRIEADRNYSRLILASGEVIVSARNLGHFQKTLPESLFFRVSQSQLVQLALIKRMVNSQTVELKDGTQLRLGKGMKQSLLERMK